MTPDPIRIRRLSLSGNRANIRPNMKRIAIIIVLPALGGCGMMGGTGGPDIHVIAQCAKQHPAPPQANVERLGLLPVYLTHAAASDDDATRQWYADMDACTANSKPIAADEKAK